METATEDSMDGGTKGDREGKKPLHDPGPACRAMHQRDLDLFAYQEDGERVGPRTGAALTKDKDGEEESVEEVEKLGDENDEG